MAINNIANGVRSSMCDALVDAIDAGTTDAGGDLLIYTAAFGTLLAEPQFGNPAFGAASNGVATVNTVTDDSSANATGTAAVCRFQDRDNATVCEGTVSTAGADLNLNNTSITATDVVAITGGTITMPAS